jgi:hypothetical protein
MQSTLIIAPQSEWQNHISRLFVGVHLADRWIPEVLDGAPVIKEVRSIVRFAHETPRGSVKLAIVPVADQLSRESANALLKTLEEPPEYLHVCLLAETKRVMPTIASRVRTELSPAAHTPDADAEQTQTECWQDALQSRTLADPIHRQQAMRALQRMRLLHPQLSHDIVLEGIFSPES